MKPYRMLLFLLVALFAAEYGTAETETYTATAMLVPPSGPAVSSFATIRITRWTTDVEREALESVLMKNGSKKAVDELHKQPETGTIKVGSGRAFLLHYARKVQVGDRTHVVVATDRPISAKELRWGDLSTNYDVAIAIFDLGADGKGEGTLSAATMLKYDVETQVLALESYAYDPVRLLNVKLAK